MWNSTTDRTVRLTFPEVPLSGPNPVPTRGRDRGGGPSVAGGSISRPSHRPRVRWEAGSSPRENADCVDAVGVGPPVFVDPSSFVLELDNFQPTIASPQDLKGSDATDAASRTSMKRSTVSGRYASRVRGYSPVASPNGFSTVCTDGRFRVDGRTRSSRCSRWSRLDRWRCRGEPL